MSPTFNHLQLQYLIHVSNILNSTLDIDTIVDIIISEIISTIDSADGGILFLYDEEQQLLIPKSSYGFNDSILDLVRLKPGESMTGMAFQKRKTLFFSTPQEIRDATQTFSHNNLEIHNGSLRFTPYSTICAPIFIKERCVGVITLDCFTENKQFNKKDIQLLEAISHQVAIAIEKTTLYKEKEKSIRLLERLNQEITQQNYLLSNSIDMHKRLSNLVLNGEGLNEILNSIQSTIKIPTLLFSNLGDLLISCKGQQLKIDIEVIKQQIEPHISVFPIQEQFITKLINNEEYYISLLPIGSKDNLLGYLTTISKNKLNEIDKTALEHACTIISLELVKEQNLLEMEQNLKGEFVEELFQGKSINENVRKRALQLNLEHNRLYQVVYINYEPLIQQYEKDKGTHFTINKKLLSLAQNFFLSGFATGMVVNRHNHIVVILSFHIDFTPEKARAFLKEKSRLFSKRMEEDFYGLSPSIGAGGLIRGLNNVYKSSQQALKCLSYIKSQKVTETILIYDELGAKRLYLNNSDEEMLDFISDTLGPLLNYENQQKDEYLETLLIYLENSQKLKDTAKKLHIHLNTLSYRIKRIEAILGISFHNEQDLLNLYLAVSMYRMMENKVSPIKTKHVNVT